MAKLEPDVISAIQRQTPKVVRKDLDKEFRKKFDEVKKRMIKEFLNTRNLFIVSICFFVDFKWKSR